jgi:hypothetical protein
MQILAAGAESSCDHARRLGTGGYGGGRGLSGRSADSTGVHVVTTQLMFGSFEETQLMGCTIAWDLDRIRTAETRVAVPLPIAVIEERVQAIPAQISKGISGDIFPDLFDGMVRGQQLFAGGRIDAVKA